MICVLLLVFWVLGFYLPKEYVLRFGLECAMTRDYLLSVHSLTLSPGSDTMTYPFSHVIKIGGKAV